MDEPRGSIVSFKAPQQPEPVQGFDQRLTVAEAAQIARCSEDTIRRAYTSGHLQVERLGKRLQCVRIRLSELDRWLTDGARTT